MDSDDSEPVGKNKHKIPPRRKGKSKREKLLNSNSGKEEKKTKRAEEQTKQEQTLSFIGRLSAPRLRRWLMAPQHVFAHTALSDVDAEFEKFAMDARCTPTRILLAHHADQVSDFVGDEGSSGLPAPHLPSPEPSKAGTMPGQDRFWLDDGQG